MVKLYQIGDTVESVILSIQWLNSIPLQVQKQWNYIIAFTFKNNKQLKDEDEGFTKYDCNEFQKIVEYVFDKPHELMVIARDSNCVIKKFNYIQIHENK